MVQFLINVIDVFIWFYFDVDVKLHTQYSLLVIILKPIFT